MKCISLFMTSTFVLILTACPQKSHQLEKSENRPEVEVVSAEKKTDQQVTELTYTKEFRESLYFAASLEREALRLITKNSAFESATLFSLMSYAFEADSGIKKSAPAGADCSRFKIEKKQNQILVSKICTKPETLIARVIEKNKDLEFEIQFITKELGSVVGLSVALTNPNVICQLRLKDKKLQSLSCQNWTFLIAANDLSSTEVKLKTFLFDRSQNQQLHLVGGFYKDLVENKKIEVIVPLEGKIKLIEKEIEVKDDFIDKLKTKEVPHGQKENIKKEDSQNENKPQEGQSEIQSEDQSQSESRNQESRDQSGIKQSEGEDPEVGAEKKVDDQNIEQDQNNGGVPKSEGRRGR